MTLPKLPRSKYTGMHHQGCYIGTVYTPEHMRAYAQKAVADEREAYALAVDNMREACASLLEANATACTNPIHRSLLQANAAEIRALCQEMPLFDDWPGGIK